MSRKATVDVFQTKTTRNDRFAQMSHQEKLIEQKKREIQAKLEQKQKSSNLPPAENKASSSTPKQVNERLVYVVNIYSPMSLFSKLSKMGK